MLRDLGEERSALWPNVSNFAYVNTLIHKCCHSRVFKHKLLDSVFEFWIGPPRPGINDGAIQA